MLQNTIIWEKMLKLRSLLARSDVVPEPPLQI
jgi:hypothetical protein